MSQSAEPPTLMDGERIAFVQACWHKSIVDVCRESFLCCAEKAGIARERVDLFEVPGSLEIPLQAKLLAKSGRYDAIVAAGFVVDGGIYRHEFVAATVIDALMHVQLECEVPILSAVLTPQHFHEHAVHEQFFREHMVVKGEEAASACVATIIAHRRARAMASAARTRMQEPERAFVSG